MIETQQDIDLSEHPIQQHETVWMQPGIQTRPIDPPQNLFATPRTGALLSDHYTYLYLHIVGHEKPVEVYLSGEVILGRIDAMHGTVPGVVLDDFNAIQLGVSRQHAMFTFEDGLVKVMDLDSANSTYLNGRRLIPYESRILRDGDELWLGKLVMHVAIATPLN